ncbi:MAG: MBL fold metallo-hydrolase [Bacilli bacterium]
MKVTKRGNVTQLSFFAPVLPMNCYVVEKRDRIFLIDTTLAMTAPQILRYLQKNEQVVTDILLTHAHMDHVGGLQTILKTFPNATVWISERDNALLQGNTALKPEEGEKPIRGGFLKEGYFHAKCVEDDADLATYFTIIPTPGHTPGHVSFLCEEENILVCGDLFTNVWKLTVTGVPNFWFPLSAMATWDLAVNYASAQTVAALGEITLAPGHGPFVTLTKEKWNQCAENAINVLRK